MTVEDVSVEPGAGEIRGGGKVLVEVVEVELVEVELVEVELVEVEPVEVELVEVEPVEVELPPTFMV